MNTRIVIPSLKKMLALVPMAVIGIAILIWVEQVYSQPPQITFDASLVEMGDFPRLAQGVGWLDEEAWDDDRPVNIEIPPNGSAGEEEIEYDNRTPVQSVKGIYKSRRDLIDALDRMLTSGESPRSPADSNSSATPEEIDFSRFLDQVTENYLMPLRGEGIQITNRQRAMLFGYALARPTGDLARLSKNRRRMEALKTSLEQLFEESGMGGGYWPIVEAASQGRHDGEVAALLRKMRYRSTGNLR